MESDEAKLFVGGISRAITEESLKVYFQKYGTVLGSSIAKDRVTKNSRGFGFVWFSEPSAADKALRDSHTIFGKVVSFDFCFFFFKWDLDCFEFLFTLFGCWEKLGKFWMNLDNWVNFFKLSILCTHLLVVTTVMSMYFVAYMFFLF